MGYNLYVGDLHGNIYAFEKAVEQFEKENLDKLIFIGDYCDDWQRTNVEILYLLKELIEYKKKNPTKVFLLLGNHDIQYYHFPEQAYRCKGFNVDILHDLHIMFRDNKDLFQMAYLDGKYLASHAGITKAWFRRYFDRICYWANKLDLKLETQLDQVLTDINNGPDAWILHTVGYSRGGIGFGGPTWADKSELTEHLGIPNYHHIVGHTPVPDIKEESYFRTSNESKMYSDMTFIDCLRSELKFLKMKI